MSALVALGLLLAAADPPAPPPALASVLVEAERAEAARLWELAGKTVKSAVKDAESRAYLTFAITENLKQKSGLKGLQLDARAIERTVIEYEVFKFDTYLAAGVFPKRYFGYFDQRHDTAAYEKTLVETVKAATALINAQQKARGSKTMVNDAEIAVTFISEGGAILLREKQAELETIHPVFGVGLDDIAIGFDEYSELVALFDERLGTRLKDIVVRDPEPKLARMMSYKEAILGTAVMWIYEKELAARKLRARSKQELGTRSVADQFIIGSLVYNSGILFSDERVEMIEHFTTGPYLARLSKANAKSRWPLPLFEPAIARERLLTEDYPDQQTSWSAVYHVLQRYGGWAALMRFTDVFDKNGAFR